MADIHPGAYSNPPHNILPIPISSSTHTRRHPLRRRQRSARRPGGVLADALLGAPARRYALQGTTHRVWAPDPSAQHARQALSPLLLVPRVKRARATPYRSQEPPNAIQGIAT
jgi:hypothetical protein